MTRVSLMYCCSLCSCWSSNRTISSSVSLTLSLTPTPLPTGTASHSPTVPGYSTHSGLVLSTCNKSCTTREITRQNSMDTQFLDFVINKGNTLKQLYGILCNTSTLAKWSAVSVSFNHQQLSSCWKHKLKNGVHAHNVQAHTESIKRNIPRHSLNCSQRYSHLPAHLCQC